MEFLPDGLINLFPAGSIWLLVIPLIIGPFIQEDTAVLYAASLSVTRSEDWMVIFASDFMRAYPKRFVGNTGWAGPPNIMTGPKNSPKKTAWSK